MKQAIKIVFKIWCVIMFTVVLFGGTFLGAIAAIEVYDEFTSPTYYSHDTYDSETDCPEDILNMTWGEFTEAKPKAEWERVTK